MSAGSRFLPTLLLTCVLSVSAFAQAAGGGPTVTTTSLPAGTQSVGYSASLSATGGTTPYTWSVVGSLPPGLTLTGAQINGVPQQPGNYSFSVTATDASQRTSPSQPLVLVVNQGLTITTTSLSPGTLGSPYSAQLQAVAGAGAAPYQWSVSGGRPPSGIGLSSSGLLSGTPTEGGSFTFGVTVNSSFNGVALSDQRTFTLVVNTSPLTILTTSLPAGTQSVAYSQPLLASGGTGNYAWTISSGSLPPGIGLNGNVLSGTPTQAGTFPFSVTVRDTGVGGVSSPAPQPLSITINPNSNSELHITSSSPLPSGTFGSQYSMQLTATGGTQPYQWSVSGGALPPGIGLSSTGLLSGTPTSGGNFSFGVTVNSSFNGVALSDQRTFTLVINTSPLTILTTSLPAGTQSVAYSQPLLASGGTGNYAWTISSGSLPPGIGLSGNVLNGTPTQAGTFPFSVTVRDTGVVGTSLQATQPLSITINPNSNSELHITSSSPLPSGTVSSQYSVQLTATGGTQPYQWSVSGGALPSGMGLSSAGLLSGTPSDAGNFSFGVTVNSSLNGVALSDQRTFTLAINTSPLTILTTSLPAGTQSVAYSQQLVASGGTGKYAWTISSGSLPPGIGLSGNVLSGTPTQAGTFPFSATVRDTGVAGTSVQATQPLSITINPNSNSELHITSSSPLPSGTVNSQYSVQLTATGATQPYQWSVSGGALPAGIGLSSAGLLSGTPSGAGNFSFGVTVSSVVNGVSVSDQRTFTLAINTSALTILTTSLPAGTQTIPYSQQLLASGGTGKYAWTVSSGSLPPGIGLNGNVLSGTPTQAGTFQFTVTVRDTGAVGSSLQATQPLSIAINSNNNSDLRITTSSPLPSGTVNSQYGVQLTATGGTQPYQWSVSGGALPPGIGLSGNVLSGIPTQTGTFQFSVTVRDSSVGASLQTTQAFSVTITSNNNNSDLRISTSSPLPSGTVNSQYGVQLTATGGTQPYLWLQNGGGVPPGVTLNQTGILAGTPTALGTFTFIAVVTSNVNGIQLTDQKSFTISIDNSGTEGFTIQASILPQGAPGVPYSAQLVASGGVAPYVFSLQSGALPVGLQLSSTGQVTGTPTVEGSSTFGIQVTDSRTLTASRTFSVTISVGAIGLSADLPIGFVNLPYSGGFKASGGVGGNTFSVVGGGLPQGLKMDVAGVVSGTPTIGGASTFIIQVKDSTGRVNSASYTITIQEPGLTVTGSSLPPGVVGTPYTGTLQAIGGVMPYTYNASGLPPGLTLAPDGKISGTPTTQGDYTIAATVTDKNGLKATSSVAMTIKPAPLGVDGTFTPTGTTGSPISGHLPISGGTPPYTCVVIEGVLPAGVSLSADCTLTGTPTVPGTYTVTAKVTDQDKSTVPYTFTITVVAPPIVIGVSTLQTGTVGTPYSQTLTAAGGAGALTWSAGNGLPIGMTLDSSGVVSGTSLNSGTFTFTATAQDKYGTSASQPVTVTFNLPPLPPVAFTGVSDTAPPASQPAFGFTLGSSYPVPVSGTMTLTFKGDDGSDDPMVQFSTGGRTLAFIIPANSTTPVFSGQNAALATGTTAGLITLTSTFQASGENVTPNPPPTQTIRIAALPPAIQDVKATRSGNTITVVVTGYVTSKQVNSASFTFNPASGANFQTTTINATLDQSFATYYAGAASAGFGSQFKFTQTFTVSGDSNAVSSVSVVFTNTQGSSPAVVANVQ